MPVSPRGGISSATPQLSPQLRPYVFHGTALTERGSHATGDCPFCDREGKFSVEVCTGLWRCLVCGTGTAAGGGNTLVFVRLLYEQAYAAVYGSTCPRDRTGSPITGQNGMAKAPPYPAPDNAAYAGRGGFPATVAADRRLLSPDTVATWGICPAADGTWLVPGYGPDGRLDQVYRRTRIREKGEWVWRLLPTPGIWAEGKVHALHLPANDYDLARPNIMVCEGPWDGMALWEVWPSDGTTNIVAVPGCNVWRDEWTELCRGKHVTLLYDSDHPRVYGGRTSRAGYDGMIRVARRLSGVAASVSWLRWGPDGYHPERPTGWDVRDELSTAENRKDAMRGILARVEHVPHEWFNLTAPTATNGQLHQAGSSTEAIPCHTWDECIEAWREAARLRQDLIDAIAVTLAVCASTQQAGNQLFLDLIGSPGSGKCLGEGTPVLMWDGYVKSVEDVRIGDMLVGPDSIPRTVTGVSSGEEELYVVTPTKGEPYVVNESHILSLVMSHKVRKYKKNSIVNISVKDYIEEDCVFMDSAKGWRAGVDWPARSVDIHPYFLGVWLGDGTTASPSVTTTDQEIVEFLQDYSRELGLLAKVRHQDNHTYVVSVTGRRGSSSVLRRMMRRHGLLGNKHIPHTYKVNSREVRLQLLAGILDTDGTQHSGGFLYTSELEHLARDVAFVARSLGLAAYISRTKSWCMYKNERREGMYWNVSISGDCSVIPTKIPRKKAGRRRQVKDVLRTGIQIDSVGPGRYYGFTLDGDGLFLLGDFTVTHNTTICQGLLVSSQCIHVECMTKILSGWKKPDDESKDCSFLARANNKTWVTCEFDVLGSSPEYHQLMGKVRRIFDGETSATYGNDDKDRIYTGLRTPWIRAGTQKMMDRMADYDQSQLGDRFLRFIITDPENGERREIARSALQLERSAMLDRSNGTTGSTVDLKTRRAHALTGGYVDWLRANAEEKISQVDVPRYAEDYFLDLAELCADLRARPNEDKRKVDNHDIKEMPTRLARQYIRLAVCLAVVLNKFSVDTEVLRIVRKVALDTSAGHSLKIVGWLCTPNPRGNGRTYQECGGLMEATLAAWTNMTVERLLNYLTFLRRIDVLQLVRTPQTNGSWLLTERVFGLYLRIMRG